MNINIMGWAPINQDIKTPWQNTRKDKSTSNQNPDAWSYNNPRKSNIENHRTSQNSSLEWDTVSYILYLNQ